MQLKKLFGICSFAFFCAGCIRPEKPIVEVCQIDIDAGEGICGMSNQGANTQPERKPLADLDKATAFRPLEWKKYHGYVLFLESYNDYLEKHCK